ncbi:MAG: hypothetical protein QOG55_1637 [Acidobacteriaceae bacterium]|jgi:hypothetical protein|nr:hypothetical protein [Acidobacteriaceae bacterium]
MRREIWIGVIEISYSVDTVERLNKTNSLTPNGRESAFTVVTTWATSYEQYSQKCRKMVESYGWTLLQVEKANAVDVTFSEEVEDMLERTRGNPSAIMYGTFYTYPVL